MQRHFVLQPGGLTIGRIGKEMRPRLQRHSGRQEKLAIGGIVMLVRKAAQ